MNARLPDENKNNAAPNALEDSLYHLRRMFDFDEMVIWAVLLFGIGGSCLVRFFFAVDPLTVVLQCLIIFIILRRNKMKFNINCIISTISAIKTSKKSSNTELSNKGVTHETS